MDGWRFKDWTSYQPSSVDAKLFKDATGKGAIKANHRRWHVKRKIRNPECPLCQDPDE
jgi:hypothetical protein